MRIQKFRLKFDTIFLCALFTFRLLQAELKINVIPGCSAKPEQRHRRTVRSKEKKELLIARRSLIYGLLNWFSIE